ncbi:Low-density lipoprotein receptor domain class A [Ancylostoma ceylanicum]|uniref:RNA-directed DNA polymerase n=1 Tax=Ancylostoma ceylanicum TaxID=53326 RepID=A0A0D6LAD8_9BILA|nr:Low-density lipoprotein receptor domain class A [Ancylostoma ceylanicum]
MVAGLRGVATYLDDILVCGRTEQEHTENLLALFERIAEYGFKVRIEKCSFAKPEIRYLGFIVDKNGRRPNPEKIEAIKSMVEPKNVGQLRAFLGMITYYATFMPTMKDLRGPLDALLKKDMKWEWTSKQQTAFEKLKKALSSELNLAHYDARQKIVVAADACDYGIGCVISHRYGVGSEKPIAHASRSLTAAEKNYSQIEKEALGIVFAVKKFHKYVFGRKFLLLTDHKPLLAIFGDKKGVPVYSANRLMRWATILLGYDFDIEYVNTTKFGQADGLSRMMQKHQVEDEDIVIASVENDVDSLLKECIRRLPVTVDDVESYTRTDPVLRKVISCVKSGKWPKANQKLAHFHNRPGTLSVVGAGSPSRVCSEANCSHMCRFIRDSRNKYECTCPLGYAISSESPSTCVLNVPCSAWQFACDDGKACVHYAKKCDRIPDCGTELKRCFSDGSDESPSLCRNLCNGKVDCEDGSDERHCRCLSPASEFDCSSFPLKYDGECVKRRLICDGFPDCENGADESPEVALRTYSIVTSNSSDPVLPPPNSRSLSRSSTSRNRCDIKDISLNRFYAPPPSAARRFSTVRIGNYEKKNTGPTNPFTSNEYTEIE